MGGLIILFIGSAFVCLLWGISASYGDKIAKAISAIGGVVAVCSLIAIIATFISDHNAPRILYDTEIRMHYVDGYSQVVSMDSIESYGLPHIKVGRGTYTLYYGNQKYHGVIRFEYLRKRKYEVSSEIYHAMIERRYKRICTDQKKNDLQP